MSRKGDNCLKIILVSQSVSKVLFLLLDEVVRLQSSLSHEKLIS